MKKLITVLLMATLAIAAPVLQTGCQVPVDQRTQAYQTLRIVGQSAKASMDTATALLKQGSIRLDQWQRVATIYDTSFQPAFRLALDASMSNLDSFASPDLINLAGQMAVIITELTTNH